MSIYDFNDEETIEHNSSGIGWKVEFDDGSMGIYYAHSFKQLLRVLEIEIFQFNPDDIIEIKKGCDY